MHAYMTARHQCQQCQHVSCPVLPCQHVSWSHTPISHTRNANKQPSQTVNVGPEYPEE